LCWNINENCDVEVAMDCTGNHSKNRWEKKFITLHVFFFLSTWPVSISGICGTLLLLLMVLMTTAKKETLFLFIQVFFCGIAGFNDQQNLL